MRGTPRRRPPQRWWTEEQWRRLSCRDHNVRHLCTSHGFPAGGRVAGLQSDGLALAGHSSDPPGWLAGAMVAPAGFSGVQPLPSAAASKSTDSRLTPAAPNIDVITQFCEVVREPLLPTAPLHVPKPAR